MMLFANLDAQERAEVGVESPCKGSLPIHPDEAGWPSGLRMAENMEKE